MSADHWTYKEWEDGTVEKIVTMARDEQDMAKHTTMRLQEVLEGREQFCLEMPPIEFPVWQSQQIARAA